MIVTTRTRALASVLLLVATATANAEPRHVLVLRAEGNADAATRGKVDAEIGRLAKSLDGNIELGEITFTDAAAAVGCSGSEAQCRDEVLGMMGVDELVSTTVTAMPSGDVRVVVHRIPKGATTKNAQSTVPTGQALDPKVAADVGPLFGVKAPVAATTPVTTTTPTTTTPTTTTTTTTTPTTTTVPTTAGTPTGAWGTTSTAAPVRTAQTDPNSTDPNALTANTPPPEGHHSHAVTGLAIGGGLVVLSVILWAEAGSVQGDINNAPTKTTADFQNLQDLESKADTYSGLGNLCFLGGLVVGGISGYFYYKDRHSRTSAQARITPTLFNHGAGIAFTYGGLP